MTKDLKLVQYDGHILDGIKKHEDWIPSPCQKHPVQLGQEVFGQ